jgi:hypothetical protein
VPRIFAEGYSSANSMAQIPVPVPKSRTFLGSFSGARWDFPWRVSLQRWCWRSINCQFHSYLGNEEMKYQDDFVRSHRWEADNLAM